MGRHSATRQNRASNTSETSTKIPTFLTKRARDITCRCIYPTYITLVMNSTLTLLAFVLACSILLSSFQEAQGVGYVYDMLKTDSKSTTSGGKKSSAGKNQSRKNVASQRQLKRQLKHVANALRKAEKRERMVRKTIQRVSVLTCFPFKHSLHNFIC